MQYWDNILYPSFRATIRGEYYGVISQDDIDEECFHLAERAIAAFKFPKISTEYKTFYAVRNEEGELQEVDPADYPEAILHGYFVNDLNYAEIEILIAWMKVYWCENQISNADKKSKFSSHEWKFIGVKTKFLMPITLMRFTQM